MKDLRQKAVLVDLTISQIGTSVKDKGITNEILSNHNASNDIGRFNKTIFNKESLKKVKEVVSELREYHVKSTLPWSTMGRLLPAKKLNDYTAAINDYMADFEDEVVKFVEDYQEHKDSAQETLGDLYNEEDYPVPDEIRSKFDIEHTVLPIPSSEDFRIVDMDSALEKGIDKKVKQLEEKTAITMYNQLLSCITRYHDTLVVPDKIFRETMIGNLKNTCEFIMSLGFSKDIEVFAESVIAKLHTNELSAANLRKDLDIRKEAVVRAKILIDEINDRLA